MSKQLAHLVLIISLVGQFLLTPAMAMPSLLHDYTHAQMSTMLHSGMSPVAVSSDSLTTPHDTDMAMTHGQRDCDMAMSGHKLNGGPTIDCDALCKMMGAGSCVSHCASATGILTQPQVSVISQESSGKVQADFWSPRTSELSSSNPPPKFELA
ncbi:hypothetical protein [uncultured Shewanella sp.]|uniref:hypothetical protein n=1 Tax=Shewanella atlantica TaxID=271099 RepID=UPI0026228090|nr:hypothetical protein [uncultured Shewanella sp.]